MSNNNSPKLRQRRLESVHDENGNGITLVQKGAQTSSAVNSDEKISEGVLSSMIKAFSFQVSQKRQCVCLFILILILELNLDHHVESLDQNPRIQETNNAPKTKKHHLIVDCSLYVDEPEHQVYVNAKTPFNMSVHDPLKEIISEYIHHHGCFECEILYAVLSALHTTKATHIIDIGANIGMYSLYAASNGYNAIAFEPFATNIEKICQSVMKNGFSETVTLFGAALALNGTEYVNFNTLGFTRAVRKRGRGEINLGSMITFPTLEKPIGEEGKDYARSITIDSLQNSALLPAPGSHIVLKVDVEGSECVALFGAMDYLSKVIIEYVAIEWSYKRLLNCDKEGHLQKIFDLFTENRLHSYIYQDHEWKEVEPIDWVTWSKQRHRGFFDLAWSKTLPNSTQFKF